MRRKFDKKILQAGVVLFLTICGCIIFYFVLFNSQDFSAGGTRLIRIFRPIITGAFFAYILNPAMMFIENKISTPIINTLYKKSKKNTKSIKRTLSIVVTMSLFLAFLYTMINLVVPQVVNSIENIIVRFPVYADQLNTWFKETLDNNPEIQDLLYNYTYSIEEWFMNSAVPKIQDLIKVASTGIIGGVMSAIKILLNLIIGLIVSIYLLSNKELFCAQAKKIVYATLREERANNLINNARFANKTFGGFLSGKILDSIIIGLLCFIVISLFNVPYAVLVSVIVGVTNVIPYFGPFLGAIPSAIIILLVNPVKCLTFIVIVLILQQIDGNIIGPKILGDSTGLSSFWVIFAITLFGGLFGVFGMFIGVPVFAVIYAAIKTFVNQRLAKKELPVSTSYYMESDYHSDEIVNSGSEIKFVKKTFDNIYVEGKKKVVKVTTEDNKSTEKKDK